MTTVFLSAGDLSGERYAASLVRALGARRGDLRFVGMGGRAMEESGVELCVDQRELAVGGLFELISSGRRILRTWRRLTRRLRDEDPAVVVLVDSGGFNLRLARWIRRAGRAKIFYYIPPQVWAWRRSRIRALAAHTDRIAVTLPFEVGFYSEYGVDVDYVGHPLLDDADAPSAVPTDSRRRRAREALGLTSSKRLLGLFPGSRRSEVAWHLESMVQVFQNLARDGLDLEGLVVRAPSLEAADFERRVAAASGEFGHALRVVDGANGAALDAVDVGLTKPGTTTLELMLRECPMVVMGRVHPLTARIVRRSLRVSYTALPNLLSEREVVPEFLQEAAHAVPIARSVSELFEGEARDRQIGAFVDARRRLGRGGAADAAAKIVEELLGSSAT